MQNKRKRVLALSDSDSEEVNVDNEVDLEALQLLANVTLASATSAAETPSGFQPPKHARSPTVDI